MNRLRPRDSGAGKENRDADGQIQQSSFGEICQQGDAVNLLPGQEIPHL